MAILHAVLRYFHTPSPHAQHAPSYEYPRAVLEEDSSYFRVIFSRFTNHVPRRLALSHYLGAKEIGFFAAGLPI